jgi:methyl-accepting chemotaxis protein
MRIKDIPAATTDEILHDLLDVLTHLRDGHLTARMTEGYPAPFDQIARTLNQHLDTLAALTREHHRIAEEIGVTGRLGGQMDVPNAAGQWKQMVDDTNRLAANLTDQVRDSANTVRDLLHGQPDARMTCQAIQGEFAALRRDVNRLADEFMREPAAGA